LKTKDKFNDLLQSEKKINEENLNAKLTEIQNKFEDKNKMFKELKENFNKLEKEYKDLVNIFLI